MVSAFRNALSDLFVQGVLLVMLEDPAPWVQWPRGGGLLQGSLGLGGGTRAAGLSQPVLRPALAPAQCPGHSADGQRPPYPGPQLRHSPPHPRPPHTPSFYLSFITNVFQVFALITKLMQRVKNWKTKFKEKNL